jgi:hypothetical protein
MITTLRNQLLEHRNKRMLDSAHFRSHFGNINVCNVRMGGYRISGLLGYQSKPGLGLGKSGFEIQPFLDTVFLGEYGPKFIGAPQVLHTNGVEYRRRHEQYLSIGNGLATAFAVVAARGQG